VARRHRIPDCTRESARAFDGALRRFEVPFPRPDGNDGTAQVLLAPVREGGRIPKVLMLVRDITEQRRTQTQLQQAEKLAAMGQLVSGVAHESITPRRSFLASPRRCCSIS